MAKKNRMTYQKMVYYLRELGSIDDNRTRLHIKDDHYVMDGPAGTQRYPIEHYSASQIVTHWEQYVARCEVMAKMGY